MRNREGFMRVSMFVAVLGVIVCTMSAAAALPSRAQTHTVTIEGMRFQPEALTVAAGDTIVWVNKDLVPHTATSETGGFDSKEIQPDKSWSYTIRKTGDFAYVCTFHPTMKAMLRVR
jgi:plastocyanin